MKFNFENEEYHISFAHVTEEQTHRKRTKLIRRTICRIWGESNEEKPFTEGSATQFHKDRIDFEIARRSALNSALVGHSRAFRKAAGDAYRLRSRSGGMSSVELTRRISQLESTLTDYRTRLQQLKSRPIVALDIETDLASGASAYNPPKRD